MTKVANAFIRGPIVNGLETPVLVDTNYTYPAGSFFVDPKTGNDANPGNLLQPFQTIAKAISVCTTASYTIVLRAGTYVESLGTINKRITLQSFPYEEVWLSGAIPLTGYFTAIGSIWKTPAIYNPSLNRSTTTSALGGGSTPYSYPSDVINAAHPMAGNPDQIFINDVPLTQVDALSKVISGSKTFYVDITNKILYVGINPLASKVDAVWFNQAMTLNASNSVVKGIGIMRYGCTYNFPKYAALLSSGTASGIQISDCTFAYNSSRGLSINGINSSVTNNIFLYNGSNGAHANTANGLSFKQNRISFSNNKHYDTTAGAIAQTAGAKLTSSSGMTVSNNTFSYNDCHGLWFDVSVTASTCANNMIVYNNGMGVQFEISDGFIAAGNTVAYNSRDGIKIAGVTNSQFWNNTCYKNTLAQIGLYEDKRTNSQAFPTWDTKNVLLKNNVLVGEANSTQALLKSLDANSPKVATSNVMASGGLDYNMYIRPSYIMTSKLPVNTHEWIKTVGSTVRYTSLAAFKSANTSLEIHGLAYDGIAISTFFQDVTICNFSPAGFSPIGTNGTIPPASVTTAMGVAAGATRYGALKFMPI